jgi:hypothetical protein
VRLAGTSDDDDADADWERAMTEQGGPAIEADDYVVRYGLRGFLAALLGLAVWTVLAVIVVAARATFPAVPAAVALAIGELGLLAACGVELHRAARREVLFAVRSDGVSFGSGQAREDVPWDRVCAVELFSESGAGRGRRGVYRCVGVRVRGAAASSGGSGAGRMRAGGSGAGRKQVAGLRAGRTNPGGMNGDETVRFAYRRMIGWRADRARLTKVVRCYAPFVPVREGTDGPATLSPAPARQPSS